MGVSAGVGLNEWRCRCQRADGMTRLRSLPEDVGEGHCFPSDVTLAREPVGATAADEIVV